MQITSSLFSLSQSLFQLRSAAAPETVPEAPQHPEVTPRRARPAASGTEADLESVRVREMSAELISRSRAGEDSARGMGTTTTTTTAMRDA